jgi:hypothetical protein
MNRDDIIRMAREACDPDTVDAWKNGYWTITQEELERFASLVAAHEREKCAKVCAALDDDEEAPICIDSDTARVIAFAIRKRGEK